MKIYTANNTETDSVDDSVEILLNYQELKKLINSLKKFEDEVNQFKTKNKEAEGLGFTHLHLKDCGLIDKNSKSDIVLYLIYPLRYIETLTFITSIIRP